MGRIQASDSDLTRRENPGLQSDKSRRGIRAYFAPCLVRWNLVVPVRRNVRRLGRLEHGSQAGLRTVSRDCLVAFPQARENNETLGRKMRAVSKWLSVLELSEEPLTVW